MLPHLKRVLNDHYGTFGYIVSYSGAKKLLANVYPLTQQIDSYIISHTRALEAQAASTLTVWMCICFSPLGLRAKKSAQINGAAFS